MNQEFVLIGDVIKKVLEEKQLFPKTLYGAWEDLVGSETARYSQPRRLVKGVLHVVVTDPVWKHHLELNKEEIVEKLNRYNQKFPIAGIRLRIGEIKRELPRVKEPRPEKKKVGRRKPKRKVALRKLSVEDRQVLKKISDVELRKKCRSLLKRVH